MKDRIEIIGYLGRDANLRYMPNGRAVADFSVAVNRTWKNSTGQKIKKTIWYNCALYGKLAESLSQYLLKGTLVDAAGQLVADDDGRPRIREYEGRKYTSFELTVKEITLLGGTRAPAPQSQGQATSQLDDYDYGSLEDDEFMDF